MQLKISREEQKKGLLFKKTTYLVKSSLVCSEEERMAIKKLDLEKMKVYEPYEYEGRMQVYTSVGAWADERIIAPVENLMHASEIEAEITEAAQSVKAAVQSFLDGGAKTETDVTIEL